MTPRVVPIIYDNHRCHLWRQSWHYDDFQLSVFGVRTSAVIIHGDVHLQCWCFTAYMAPPLHLCFPGPEGHEINRMIWTHIPINWQFCSWWEIHNSRIMWSVISVKRWPTWAVYFAHLSTIPPRWAMDQFPLCYYLRFWNHRHIIDLFEYHFRGWHCRASKYGILFP